MARRLAAVPDQPGRAVLYIRVSAVMGRDDLLSPDIQLAAMRGALAPAGLREVAVVDDIDVSGRTFSRAGIDRIRAMAQSRQVDAIAVYNVSRLGRNVLESLLFLQELMNLGVTIISATEHIDTSTPSGEMMLTNMLAIAQYQSQEIGAGWSRAIAGRAKRGDHHGRPLGYTRRNKRLMPDPTLGPAIALAFARYGAGDPIGDICRYVAAVRQRPILAGNLKKIFRNPVYLGQVVAAGQLLPGQHEPLVDEPTWQAVQDRLARDAGTPPRHLAPTWSLVGLAVCPAGHHLQRQPHVRTSGASKGMREDRLVCGGNRSDRYGTGRCPGIGRPLLGAVEAEVLRQVAAYAGKLRDDHAERAARRARIAAARADRAALERELRNLRSAMARLAREWATRQLPDEVYRATLADLRRSETDTTVELARLAPVQDVPEPEQAASAADALLALWPDMTAAERGRALRAIVRQVVVRPAVRWREPECDRVDVQFLW